MEWERLTYGEYLDQLKKKKRSYIAHIGFERARKMKGNSFLFINFVCVNNLRFNQ